MISKGMAGFDFVKGDSGFRFGLLRGRDGERRSGLEVFEEFLL